MSTEDASQPPLLYDVVIPGEQVREQGGPWLHPSDTEPAAGDEPPARPWAQGAWPQGPEAGTGGTAGPGTPSAQQRAEIERLATRELARHLRSQLGHRLPEALREAEAPIRKAVEDALIDAVAVSRRHQPPPEANDDEGAAPEADASTNPPAPNR
ncbi:MAG: hypothetical protein ACOC0M_08995 [Halomonas sp.]